MPSVIALIGARSGSERVANKNIRPLAGHPLLAYAIATAQQAGVFERVVVSTDSEEIAEVARWYGADVPFLRPAEYATSTSPDIEWITYTLDRLPESYDLFAIVRATNPFRGPDVVRRGLEQLLATPEADSIRAVELVKQHPGKMWELADDGRTMAPAARPVPARRRVARRPVPGAAARLPPEQRARDRVDARRDGDGHPRRPSAGAVPHRGPGGLQRRRRGGLAAGGGARRVGRGHAHRGSIAPRTHILTAHEGGDSRDAVLRRRLAAVDLPQGDHGRRARRLERGDRLARLAARPLRHRRGSRRRSSSAATRARGKPSTGTSTARPGRAPAASWRRRSRRSRTRCST